MDCIDPERRQQDKDNWVWIRDAEKNALVVGTQCRILYQDAEGRVRIALKFNEMVRNGEIGPVMLGRDHHDVSSAEVYFEPGAPALTSSDEEDEEADDLFVIGERDTINIDTQLRDAIITLVDPLPLCSPDCAGLCDVCGDKWADLPADHEHFVVDPRLASLASLLDEHTEPGRS